MRPFALLAAILSMVIAFGVVVWLGAGSAAIPVTATTNKDVASDPFITPSKTGPHPKLELVEKKFDFGTVRQFDSGKHAFLVKNTGKAPLHLKAMGTTCGQCTISELKQNIVAPGETAEIEIQWTIKNPSPQFEQSGMFRSNDPANPEFNLTVKGFVGVDLTVMPQEAWSMGGLDVVKGGLIEGYVFSQITDKFEITKIDSTADWLQAKFEPQEAQLLEQLSAHLTRNVHATLDGKPPENPPIKCGYKITVTAPPEGAIGQFNEKLTIHTDLERVPTLEVTVTGSRPGPFQFLGLPGTNYIPSGMALDAGDVDSSKGGKAEVLMIPRGMEGDLTIEVLKAEPTWLKPVLIKEGMAGNLTRYRLRIEIPPGVGNIARTLSNPATVKLKTNHPTAGELTIRVAFVAN